MSNVTKLVIPVAGLGLRLRPLTLTTPKNLLPLGGKPIVEYALEEAVRSGIATVVLVISPEHRAQYETYLANIADRFAVLKLHLREQAEPLGHGDAVLKCQDLLDADPFLVRFPDDLYPGAPPITTVLVNAYERLSAPVVLLEHTPWEEVSRYGVIQPEAVPGEGVETYQVKGVVEKPPRELAPSNLTIRGGYILDAYLLQALRDHAGQVKPGLPDSVLIGDALQKAIEQGCRIFGIEPGRKRLDCGSLAGYYAAEEAMRINSA
ncbi:MAG: hypothetical protein HY978_04435 [Candidatus Liptonbacteria bacterium]|nr:hypothetical protein [Candidatus Liptonbacteria bacterium]